MVKREGERVLGAVAIDRFGRSLAPAGTPGGRGEKVSSSSSFHSSARLPKKFLCTRVSLTPAHYYLPNLTGTVPCGQQHTLVPRHTNCKLSWLLPAPVPRSVPADFKHVRYIVLTLLQHFRGLRASLSDSLLTFGVHWRSYGTSTSDSTRMNLDVACANVFVLHDSQRCTAT